MVPQIHPAQPPGLVEMRVGPFEQLAPLPQQPLPTGAPNPPAIGVDRVTGHGLAPPVAPATIRLRDITAHAEVSEGHHRLVAVIPLVPDHLGDAGQYTIGYSARQRSRGREVMFFSKGMTVPELVRPLREVTGVGAGTRVAAA